MEFLESNKLIKPTINFLPATRLSKQTRGTRSYDKIRRVVIHSAICCGGSVDGAESLAKYHNNGADGRGVSWHMNTDSDSAVQTLGFNYIGRHTGSQYSDLTSVAIEMAVHVKSSKDEWFSDPKYDKTFEQTAKLTAAICTQFDLPGEALTAADLRADKKGIISHNLSRIVYGGTTHTDPGPFPWLDFQKAVKTFMAELGSNGGGVVVDPKPDADSSEASILFQLGASDPYEYVSQLYKSILGRQATNREIASWIDDYNIFDAVSAEKIYYSIKNSDEAKKR